MPENGVNLADKMKSINRCNDVATIQFSSMIEQSEMWLWMVAFTWSNSSGVQTTAMGRRWLKITQIRTDRLMRVVTVNDKPFTFVANHYETKRKSKPCDQGLACTYSKVSIHLVKIKLWQTLP